MYRFSFLSVPELSLIFTKIINKQIISTFAKSIFMFLDYSFEIYSAKVEKSFALDYTNNKQNFVELSTCTLNQNS